MGWLAVGDKTGSTRAGTYLHRGGRFLRSNDLLDGSHRGCRLRVTHDVGDDCYNNTMGGGCRDGDGEFDD